MLAALDVDQAYTVEQRNQMSVHSITSQRCHTNLSHLLQGKWFIRWLWLSIHSFRVI